MMSRRLWFSALICTSLLGLAACGGASDDLADAPNLEVAASLDHRPVGVAISRSGRVFVSMRPLTPTGPRVAEVMDADTTRPFPNAEWNLPPTRAEDPSQVFYSVNAVHADRENVVWMLDQGGAAPPKLVGWSLELDRERDVFRLEAMTGPASTLADFAIDQTNRAIYIADTGAVNAQNTDDEQTPTIIVVNLDTGRGRRVLGDDERLRAEDVDLEVGDESIGETGPEGFTPLRVGLRAITIDPMDEWVYFGALNGESLYRIRAADLSDRNLTDIQIKARVEFYGLKPVSEGIAAAQNGFIFISDVNSSTLGVVGSDAAYQPLVTDRRLSWPHAIAISPGGDIFVAASRMQQAPQLNNGKELAEPPFHLLRSRLGGMP